MSITVIAGTDSSVSVHVMLNGNPLPLSGSVNARVFTMDGKTELMSSIVADSAHPDANWPTGLIAVTIPGTLSAAFQVGEVMLVLTGTFGIKRFKLIVETLFAPTRTSLFVKDIIVNELRQDRLMAAAAGVLQDVIVSDDYLWEKVRAAESEISHMLRVPLVPTRFFPEPPTQEQIDELDGMAWAIDPAYDYSPDMFRFENWGYFITRQRPIVDIIEMRFAYPSRKTGFFSVPNDWIRIDARYGHVRLVPASPALYFTMDSFIMTALNGSRSIPFMIQLTYTAGLTDVSNTYPELLDAIKKKAVLKVVADAFLPQSGSISADGLSESVSVDVSKYHDSVEHIINGPAGSNGGLMSKIHGIRMMVM